MSTRARVAVLLLALGLGLAGAAGAQVEAFDPGEVPETFTINFHKAEIHVLAQFISSITGKNIFIFEEKVRQKLSIFSPVEVTADEAFELFKGALDAGGTYTIVPYRGQPDAYKIVLRRDAGGMDNPVVSGSVTDSSRGPFLTQLVRLRYVDATALSQVLQQLLTRDGKIVPYPPTNTLIIADTTNNIARLLEMIRSIDVQESEQQIEVIQLRSANAEDIAAKITEILTGDEASTTRSTNRGARRTAAQRRAAAASSSGGSEVEISPGKPVKILPYERTNSLIVVAGQNEIDKIRELVTTLDFPAPMGRTRFNVIRLNHARADEMVEVLSQLLSGSSGGGARRTGATRARGSDGATSGIAAAARASAEAGAQFTEEVSITADPATNSLVVSAAPEDFLILKPVIEQLDVSRNQVFIEAVILEVTMTDTETLGVQFASIQGDGDVASLTRTTLGSPSIADTLLDPLTAFPAGFGAAITSTETVAISDATGNTVEVPAVSVLIQALAGSSKVNVLSTPHILTMDNEEAEIVVGQNVPFPTGTVFSSGGVNPVQTVERQDVGLTLRVTPRISKGDFLSLDIFQEISSVLPTADVDVLTALGPTTSKRSAETTVVVRDRHPVVIGGLIEDRITETESKVPYLGDIPYLGWLFRVSTDQVDKVNLLIMITPYIIRSPADLQATTNDHREDTDAFFQGMHERNVLEDHLDRKRIQRQRARERRRTAPADEADDMSPWVAPLHPAPESEGETRQAPGLTPVGQPNRSNLGSDASGGKAAASGKTRVRVAQAYGRDLDVALPEGFEDRTVDLEIAGAMQGDEKVVGLLVELAGNLVFSRYLDSGLLENDESLRLYVDGLEPGRYEIALSVDVKGRDGETRQVRRNVWLRVEPQTHHTVRGRLYTDPDQADGWDVSWDETEVRT